MKTSKRAVTALAAAGLLLSTLAPGVAFAEGQTGASQLCPGDNQNAPDVPDDLEVVTDNDTTGGLPQAERNDFVPAEGTLLCIKAGAGSTGIFTADGSGKTLQDLLLEKGIVDGSGEAGRDVSHYVIYARTVTPDPTCPDDATANPGATIPDDQTETDYCTVEITPDPTCPDDADVNAGATIPEGQTETDFCNEDDKFFVQFTKDWAGDDIDLEDVEVTFVIDDNLKWKLGAAPAQVGLGETYEVEEVVTGLPDNCDYTTDLKSSYTIPTDLKNGEVVIIHVTNKVTCTEVEDDASFNVSFTKAWVGDTELAHLDDVSVTFDVMIDGSEQTVADGEVVKVDGSPDDIDVELLDEHINGLPDNCTWKFDGTSLADADNIDVTVTNKVTCTEVESVVIEKPHTPPHTSPVVTGKAPVAPAVTGKAPVALAVTGKAPVAPVEVKGVSMTAGRQEMPRTGVPALLLSLMGMAALGTGGMMVRRRP